MLQISFLAPSPLPQGLLGLCLAQPPATPTGTTMSGPDPVDEKSIDERPLWQLVVAALPQRDLASEWFSLREIGPLLNLTPHALTHHCRDLWPEHEGHWRLNPGQATSLIRRVCYAGRKLPSRAQVLGRLEKRGEATC